MTFRKILNIIYKNLFRSIFLAVFSLAGIISLAVDVAKPFMSTELMICVTFLTALISFVTVLLPLMEVLLSEYANKVQKKDLEQLLDSCGMKIKKRNEDTSVNVSNMPLDLLYVVAQIIHKGPERCVDGRTSLKTQYYVYTLSASHHNELLRIMTDYMSEMLRWIMEKKTESKTNVKSLFFIIVPFARNILLGESVADRLQLPVLISELGKPATDTGARISIEENSYENFYQTFIGVDALEKYVKEVIMMETDNNIIYEINGIIIDCNTSGGSLLTRISNYFNNTLGPEGRAGISKMIASDAGIDSDKIRINPIRDASVLFLAFKSEKEDCAKRFKDADLRLSYFFELDEEIKKEIYDNRCIFEPSATISTTDSEIIKEKYAKLCGFKLFDKNTSFDKSIIEIGAGID